ncbi:MAG: SLC13 family permease [Bacteroidota bacterium]
MSSTSQTKSSKLKTVSLIGTPIICLLIILFADLEQGKPEITYTFAIALLMAVWWVTEALPLAVTALLPVILFPLFGIVDGKTVSVAYFNHLIFLFIGGFLMALAMEKWNLHKRIAIKILIAVGVSPGRILLGFMFASTFLSMWISNTATTMMMIPIVLSIIYKLEESIGKTEVRKYSIGLLLGIAYAATIGGIATLVGTFPNLAFARIFSIMFPSAPEISFTSWFAFALPVTVFMFIFAWILIYFIHKPTNHWPVLSQDTFRKEYKELGKASFEEKIVFIHFITLALLWIFRNNIIIGEFFIPGWSSLFGNPKFINDGTVAIAISVILFAIPSRSLKGTTIMDWETAKRLPWNIILLFGGGFALAEGFVESGLSLWFGEQLKGLSAVHPFPVILVIVTMMSFLTELTSNTATTQMLLPIFAGLSVIGEVNPLLFMIPTTLAASLAFMLPVATPPNIIVFGTDRIRIIDMVKTGFLLNTVGIIVVTLITYFWGIYIFDIDISVFPEWGSVAGVVGK